MDIQDILKNIDYNEFIVKYSLINPDINLITKFFNILDNYTIKDILLSKTNYDYGNNILFETLFHSDINIIILLLKQAIKCKIDLKNMIDNYNNNLLHLAIERDNYNIVELLLKQKCDIHKNNNDNESPLDYSHDSNINLIELKEFIDIEEVNKKLKLFCGFHTRLGNNSPIRYLPFDLIYNI